MDVHLRVDLDDDGPVVVKSATAAGAERLHHERARLERAVHPGVVALAGRAVASTAGDTELRTLYAGDPVARWSGSVSRIAGLGAAVASTLADLHDLSIVHGRLDATHILIGDDGRPRLCGFSHRGDADPSDDVASLGAVLDQLVERARPEAARRFPLRRDAGGSRRRLRSVIEHATDPVASRRPSARALADAILRAVPAAVLPAGSGHGAGSAERARQAGGGPTGPTREPDTLDRIWAFSGEPSDDERWAAALGTGPPDLVPRHGDDPLPLAPVDTPAWPDERDDPLVDASGREAEDDSWASEPDGDPDDAHERRGPTHGPDDHGPQTRGHGPPRDADGDGAYRPDDHGRTRDRHDDADDHDDRSGAPYRRDAIDRRDATPASRGEAPDPDGDPTRDHRPAPRRVAGARPGTERSAASAPRRHTLVLGAAALVAAAVAAGGAMILGTGGGADTPRPDAAIAPTADCPPVTAPAADVDGDGCPEHLVVDGTTVDAGVARWSLGEPGDVVALGSWYCDGQAAAALLRPATGDVFFFSDWAGEGEPVTVRASQRVVGAVGIRADPDGEGCDRLVVDLDTGGSSPVEVPR